MQTFIQLTSFQGVSLSITVTGNETLCYWHVLIFKVLEIRGFIFKKRVMASISCVYDNNPITKLRSVKILSPSNIPKNVFSCSNTELECITRICVFVLIRYWLFGEFCYSCIISLLMPTIITKC